MTGAPTLLVARCGEGEFRTEEALEAAVTADVPAGLKFSSSILRTDAGH